MHWQRTFLSLLLSTDEQQHVCQLIKTARLSCTDKAWQWHTAQQLHLTLVFMGPLTLQQQQTLSPALASELTQHPAFQYSIRGLRCWRQRQQTLLIADIAACPALTHLQQTLRQLCQNHHTVLKDEHTFIPHITLARRPYCKQVIDYKKITNKNLRAETVYLMHSYRHQYHRLEAWQLGKPSPPCTA